MLNRFNTLFKYYTDENKTIIPLDGMVVLGLPTNKACTILHCQCVLKLYDR